MQFGTLVGMQLPKPWKADSEFNLYRDALEQTVLADRLGYSHVWAVEHHFLEEYSHSSAPEVFLAAAAARTQRIRIGHGIVLSPPAYNHPARVAERIGALDLISGGRVEWGTGESASAAETGGFGVALEQKRDMWTEAVAQTADMMAMTPYPGHQGRYFSMPCRNVVPKPLQKPHPPLWIACSRRETIHFAARMGAGALAFSFLDNEVAAKWVQEYYDIIKSEQCVPIGHTVNANIALVNGFSCHPDSSVAYDRAIDGFKFFGYSLGHHYIYGEHTPGRTDLWRRFQEAKGAMPDGEGRGGIGSPDEIRAHMRAHEAYGLDQIIFTPQNGMTEHGHICESYELFARDVLPEFAEREEKRQKRKQAELAPYIEQALLRRAKLAQMRDEEIPKVSALGRKIIAAGNDDLFTELKDRGGPAYYPLNEPGRPGGG